MLVFIKAVIPAHGQSDLFPQTVQVKGHVRGTRFVLPHRSTRHKTIDPAPHQPKPVMVVTTAQKTIEKPSQMLDTPYKEDKPMIRLNQTEVELLKRAKSATSGKVSTLVTVHTGYTPARSMGSRERAAATSLRDKGLLEFVSTDHYVHTGYNGTTTHCHDALWVITDKGRAHDLGA